MWRSSSCWLTFLSVRNNRRNISLFILLPIYIKGARKNIDRRRRWASLMMMHLLFFFGGFWYKGSSQKAFFAPLLSVCRSGRLTCWPKTPGFPVSLRWNYTRQAQNSREACLWSLARPQTPWSMRTVQLASFSSRKTCFFARSLTIPLLKEPFYAYG